MGNEPLLAQFAVDIAECRLLLVEAKKRDLRLDGDRLLQLLAPASENSQFGALNVDFQQTQIADFAKCGQHILIRKQQACHSRCSAEAQFRLVPVSEDMVNSSSPGPLHKVNNVGSEHDQNEHQRTRLKQTASRTEWTRVAKKPTHPRETMRTEQQALCWSTPARDE